jgi:hypothetical protein
MATGPLYRQKPGLMVREAQGEMVVLDAAAERIHQLNVTAALAWRMCADTTTAGAVAAALASRYDVEEHMALRDAHAVLEQLVERGLVMREPPPR